MGWIFGKEKGSKKIRSLVHKEVEFQEKELQLIDKALDEFSRAAHLTYFFSSKARSQKICTIPQSKFESDYKKFLDHLDNVDDHVSGMKRQAKKVLKIAKELNDYLRSERGGKASEPLKYLSESEYRVLAIAEDYGGICSHIIEIIRRIKRFRKEHIKNVGYFGSDFPEKAEKFYDLMQRLNNSLAGFKENIRNLYELEKKVEQMAVELEHMS